MTIFFNFEPKGEIFPPNEEDLSGMCSNSTQDHARQEPYKITKLERTNHDLIVCMRIVISKYIN